MRESNVGRTLVALRDDGYRVKVSHTRRYLTKETAREYYMDNKSARRMRADGVMEIIPEPTGGIVMVRIAAPGGESAAGYAGCSVKESFVGLRGTAIALGRALDELALRLGGTDAQAD